MKETVLIVDDEVEILNLLEIYIENEGYQVVKCENGAQALESLETEEISMAILDVMLPDIDGFSLCKKIREKFYFPIIMLTAKNEDSDMIAGLTMGADDYITKPFKPIEVIARMKTQLRRYRKYNQNGQGSKEEVYDFHGLYVNCSTHKAALYEEELNLTKTEFSILSYLCGKRGQVVSSEELFEAVWGTKFIDSNNTVMTHIGRLREKMHESARKPKFVKTVWGVGYTIE